MRRVVVDVSNLADAIFEELNEIEKYELVEHILSEYGKTENCKNCFGDNLIDEFTIEEVKEYFNIE